MLLAREKIRWVPEWKNRWPTLHGGFIPTNAVDDIVARISDSLLPAEEKKKQDADHCLHS